MSPVGDGDDLEPVFKCYVNGTFKRVGGTLTKNPYYNVCGMKLCGKWNKSGSGKL